MLLNGSDRQQYIKQRSYIDEIEKELSMQMNNNINKTAVFGKVNSKLRNIKEIIKRFVLNVNRANNKTEEISNEQKVQMHNLLLNMQNVTQQQNKRDDDFNKSWKQFLTEIEGLVNEDKTVPEQVSQERRVAPQLGQSLQAHKETAPVK